MSKEFLSAEEAAEELGLTERTIREMARNKEIPCRKVGRRWIFSKTALIDWISKGNQEKE